MSQDDSCAIRSAPEPGGTDAPAEPKQPSTVDAGRAWWSGRRLRSLDDDELARLARENPEIVRRALLSRRATL